MNKEDLIKLKETLSLLSESEMKERKLYLRDLALGNIQGPPVGYASIDQPWLKNYSVEAITSDVPKMTAYEYMKSENKDNMHNMAINYFGTKVNYGDFIKKIDHVAECLYNMGVRDGDVVTIISITNPELEILFYALNKIGAIINLTDVRSDFKTIKNNLLETNSKHVFVMDNFLIEFDKALADSGVSKNVTDVVTISPYNSVLFPFNKLAELKNKKENTETYLKTKSIKDSTKYISWNQMLKTKKKLEGKWCEYSEGKIAAYVHTGGTTGIPKTVMLSNENFNATAFQYKLLNTGYDKGDKFLNGIVPFVAYGINVTIHMPMCLGLTNIIAPILSPKEFTEWMIKHNPNHIATVPTYVNDLCLYISNCESEINELSKKYNSLNKKEILLEVKKFLKIKGFSKKTISTVIEKIKLGNEDIIIDDCVSDLKHLGVGGESFTLSQEMIVKEFINRHCVNASLDKGWAMTELSGCAVTCMSDVNKNNSLGIPLPKTSFGIFDPVTHEELQYNEEGEVCVSTPTSMYGYLDNTAEQNIVLKQHNGKNWVHSGDLGMIDNDGFLYFKGRIKRMIIHGGFKIYPNIMENVISMHNNVDQCCVIGIPNDEFGFSPEAHIILKNIYSQEDIAKVREEIANLCVENLPEYSQPIDIIFDSIFPLTSVGKVDYKTIEKERIKKLKR